MVDREGLGGHFSYSSDDHRDKKEYAVRKNTPYYSQDINEGIQFILSHFQEPIFPRTISTKNTGNAQIPIDNLNDLYSEFKRSNFVDCRISAFPLIDSAVPNLVFIDLDTNPNHKTPLEEILKSTLTKIKKRLGGVPTVLWTGNGYHIYQPFEVSQSLTEMDKFREFENVDNRFLQFEKNFLSDGHADKSNHPSLSSCLLRVPGSLNSKFLDKGLSEEDYRVKIIQEWNRKRIPISYQLGTFHSYLVTEREKEEKRRALYNRRQHSSEPKEILWIEKLLNTSIDDHRYFCVWHILIPYLVNVKHLQASKVNEILESWLRECDTKRKVDFDIKYTIKYNMKNVKDFGPISFSDLKKDYPDLYEKISISR